MSGISLTLLEQQLWNWLDDVVIGLNLCPFAKKPRVNQQIKIHISNAKSDEALVSDFLDQLEFLRDIDPNETDTTLFAIPEQFADFDDYLQFVDIANIMVQQLGLEGDFQLATFHPNYQFEGTSVDDRENLTNKAPCPVIHIIRESTVEKVLKKYPNPELIPENNINRVESLSDEEVISLYPFLKSK